MKFKNSRIEREWSNPLLDSRLKEIVIEAQNYALVNFGWEFTLTSIWRSAEEDADLGGSGVHPAWRAVDVRSRNVDTEHVKAVTDFINGNWIYNHEAYHLNVCFSAPHGTGPHLHFQSHPNTTRR